MDEEKLSQEELDRIDRVHQKPRPRPRGFAAMDKEVVRAISSKGGKAAHAAGTAHEFSIEEARAAGSKGGKAVHAKRAAKKMVW